MKLLHLAVLSIALATIPAYAQSPASTAADHVSFTRIPHLVSASNQDREWQPTDELRERVLRDVRAYLAAKDEGRFTDAYALFAPSQKAAVPFGVWEADMRKIYAQAGTAEGRIVKKVTWYKNPVTAEPGIYAAVDFSSQFSGLSLHCGFVAMQLQADGVFSVAREEENSISRRQMEKLTPEMLQEIRAQYRC